MGPFGFYFFFYYFSACSMSLKRQKFTETFISDFHRIPCIFPYLRVLLIARYWTRYSYSKCMKCYLKGGWIPVRTVRLWNNLPKEVMQGKLLRSQKSRPNKIQGNLTKRTSPYRRDSIWPTCNSWCILQLAVLTHSQESTWKLLDLLTWSNTQWGLTWQPLVFYGWCNSLNWSLFFHLNLSGTVCTSQKHMKCESVKANLGKRENWYKSVHCFSCHRSVHLPLSPCPKSQLPLLAFAPFGGPTPPPLLLNRMGRGNWAPQLSKEEISLKFLEEKIVVLKHWWVALNTLQDWVPAALNGIRYQRLKLWLTELNKPWEVRTWPLLQ